MSANTAFVPPTDTPLARPRVRYAAIVFGTIACGIGAMGLVMAANPGVRNEVLRWLGTLTPITATLAAFIALGGLVLVVAALSLIRAGQRRSARAERERATVAAAAAAPAAPAAAAAPAASAGGAESADTTPFDEVFPWAAAENADAAANAANATAGTPDAASNAGGAGTADDADTVPIADLDAADASGDDTADPSARDGR